eukprot:scaffold686_cov234-Pinguiococcus_pyrenoidosus.AAC.3
MSHAASSFQIIPFLLQKHPTFTLGGAPLRPRPCRASDATSKTALEREEEKNSTTRATQSSPPRDRGNESALFHAKTRRERHTVGTLGTKAFIPSRHP